MEWLYDKINRVPPISDRQIELMRHIEPVLLDGGMFRRIAGANKIHPRDVSCIWDAEPVGERFTFDTLNTTTILTQHHSAVFFKPSLAEVYAWIRFYAQENWNLFKFFCLREAERIGGTTDIVCKVRHHGRGHAGLR